MTSAVRAGWICIGIGWLAAWFFPPFQVFFGIALTMSVVAMASHQVRSGLCLLAAGFASIVLCGLLFFLGVMGVFVSLLALAVAAPRAKPPLDASAPATFPVPAMAQTFSAPPPSQTWRGPAAVGEPVVSRDARLPMAATRPLRLADVMFMLRTGLRDDEIIAAIADRQLVEPIDGSQVDALRALGAGDPLLNNLCARRLYASPAFVTATPVAAPAARTLASPHAPPSAQLRAGTPPDYAARDRQIAALNKQINNIDESIRIARSRLPNATDYLNGLDKARNDLRRQKWALEGR